MTQVYDPATQAALNDLERQLLYERQANNVPISIDREAGINNPYYNIPGSRSAYEQYGIPPVLVQDQPYATAAYMTQPDGSVSPLIGYPSVYPHVLNGVPQDYAAPYLMGGTNFAAGGTYGYDPNVAVQQAQQLVTQLLRGNMAPMSVAPISNATNTTQPTEASTQGGGKAAKDPVPNDTNPVPPYPPGPSGPGTSGPAPAPAATVPPNMVWGRGFTGMQPVVPVPSPEPTPGTTVAPPPNMTWGRGFGGRRASLPAQNPDLIAPEGMGAGAGAALGGAMYPGSGGGVAGALLGSNVVPQVAPTLTEVSAPVQPTAYNPTGNPIVASESNAASLTGADKEAWDEYLSTGRYRSIYYPNPQTQAQAQGLVIPAGRDPLTPNEWMNTPVAQETTVPTASSATPPPTVVQGDQELSPILLSAMQNAAAILQDPNTSWAEKVQARMEMLQLMTMYGMSTGVDYLGQSFTNAPENFSRMGQDLVRASRQGGNAQNGVVPMLMPKPIPTPMGPVFIP